MPDFTAYVVTVAPRENVVTKIISIFEEMSPETVTVLSATGQVSTVVIFGFGGTVTYKGNFDILSLCGQCMCTKVSNSEEGKNVMLASSLSAPDGNVFGGVLESAMIAATPVEGSSSKRESINKAREPTHLDLLKLDVVKIHPGLHQYQDLYQKQHLYNKLWSTIHYSVGRQNICS
ncbi:putative PPC domain-containing protein [Lupinus albus]|uniref:AT-hook motif nuclear-localized protein n=1 Tax=Lupinus albus TaxID=3870 RepID=A0A6A4P2F1_LUPAL|nr:putative PPC domain-containing protein [Lupinus albus]